MYRITTEDIAAYRTMNEQRSIELTPIIDNVEGAKAGRRLVVNRRVNPTL